MLPLNIEVTNFSSYKHEILDFTKLSNIFLVMGENGAGKSSIIDIITTAIFNQCHGVDSRGSGMDDLIHQGEDSFKIDYTFQMDNHIYRIIRERKKNKGQSLNLYIDNNDFTGKLQETQQRINDIFKMDYDTFMDTIIIGQNESAGFIKKSPNERKKIIAQILRLDRYDILESYTKDTKKQMENEIANLKNEMNELYDSINRKSECENDLKSNKNFINNIQQKIKLKEQELEQILIEKTKYEELKKQQDSIINRKNSIIVNLKSLNLDKTKCENVKRQMNDVITKKEETFSKIESINQLINNLQVQEKDINKSVVELQTKNNLLESNIENLKKQFVQLKNFNDCICKFCGQQITPEHKEKHLSDLKNEASKYQMDINHNTIKIKELNEQLSNIKQKILSSNNEYNQLLELKNKIQIAEVKIENVNSKLIDVQNRISELEKEKLELDKIDITALENKTFNDSNIRYELQNMRNELSNKTTIIGMLETQLETIRLNEKKYSDNKVEFDKKQELIDIYTELQKSWSKKGIQSIIIANVLPQIEDEINKYLKILSNNKITIKFETEKEAKNGNKSDTLDIIVKDSNGERPYERYSGGEKTRINFAFHIGMSKFLARRSGATIDFFIIDEGIGTLDDNGKDEFIDAVNSLTLIFKKVMIISHIPDIKEAFDNKVLVTKTLEDGSKLNILN